MDMDVLPAYCPLGFPAAGTAAVVAGVAVAAVAEHCPGAAFAGGRSVVAAGAVVLRLVLCYPSCHRYRILLKESMGHSNTD